MSYRGIKITIGDKIHQDPWFEISSVKKLEKERSGDANFKEYTFRMTPVYPIMALSSEEFLPSLQKGGFYFRRQQDIKVEFINTDGTLDSNFVTQIKNADWYNIKIKGGNVLLQIGVSALTNISSIHDYFSIRFFANEKLLEDGFNIVPLEGRWYRQRLGMLNNVVPNDENTISNCISSAGHLSGITVAGNVYTNINFDPRDLNYRLVETVKPEPRKQIRIVASLGKANLAINIHSVIKVHVAYAPEDVQLNKVVSVLLEEVFSS